MPTIRRMGSVLALSVERMSSASCRAPRGRKRLHWCCPPPAPCGPVSPPPPPRPRRARSQRASSAAAPQRGPIPPWETSPLNGAVQVAGARVPCELFPHARRGGGQPGAPKANGARKRNIGTLKIFGGIFFFFFAATKFGPGPKNQSGIPRLSLPSSLSPLHRATSLPAPRLSFRLFRVVRHVVRHGEPAEAPQAAQDGGDAAQADDPE